ncbi:hypothetical protein EJ05DRAFT_502174 [Pseudovirgaria hyperparasitica]|uniref:Metallo-beta-lactamase domain-containing protein n=1 Tax=Pseudovirgaria hyperparasitica TaxID=470096 RepID=A0A6A6W415_9PEZI|nr:uncharacterized protein EJ05DRAFT_502174 [Pseudovirgaria hyperparasitica]KAF2756680.1 hypothetical protein EJ05DRAFT_502174 [Pseudovirgaria hyperparasitica]
MVDVSMAIDLQRPDSTTTANMTTTVPNTLTFTQELENSAICMTCGTQYAIPLSSAPKTCRICADPRQFIPGNGQTWSSYAQERNKHENHFTQDPHDKRDLVHQHRAKGMHALLSKNPISTAPLGISQRAILIRTPHGNILWDLLAWIDSKTKTWITSQGTLTAIIISHPHFYTTHALCSTLFPHVPIHTHARDTAWLNYPTTQPSRRSQARLTRSCRDS